MGISRDLFNLLGNYLSGTLQRVVYNGQTWLWRIVLSGIPQGFILGPLFLLVNISGLPNGSKYNANLQMGF